MFIGYYSFFIGRLEYVDSDDKRHEDPLILSGYAAGFFVLLLLIIALIVWLCRRRDASSSSVARKAHLATFTGIGQPQGGVLHMPAVMRKGQLLNTPSCLQTVVFDGIYTVPTEPGEYPQHEYCTNGEKIDTKK